MEGFQCAACGAAIAQTAPAYAVHITPATPKRRRPTSWRGWLCEECTAKNTLIRHEGEHVIYPERRPLDPPAPCAGCGRLVAIPHDKRRKHVTCSGACLVRISPSHRNRTISSPAVTECQECGEAMTTGRAGRRYCSSACRQRAYRARCLPQSVTRHPGNGTENIVADLPQADPPPPAATSKRARRHQFVTAANVETLTHLLDGLGVVLNTTNDQLDPAITAEEAARLASELSKSTRSARRLQSLLRR